MGERPPQDAGTLIPDDVIGRRVRAVRLHRGWNREALAFKSGVSWSAVAQVESGRRRNLRPGTLHALSQALGVSIDYLVTGAQGRSMLEHSALLYESGAEFAATVVPFIEAAAKLGEPVLVIPAAENAEHLRRELGRIPPAVELADRESWFLSPQSMHERLRSYMEQSLNGGANWVRVVGEIAWARPGSANAPWQRYEHLLNLSFAAMPATIMCAYDTRSLDREIIAGGCAAHPRLIDRGGASASASYSPLSGLLG